MNATHHITRQVGQWIVVGGEIAIGPIDVADDDARLMANGRMLGGPEDGVPFVLEGRVQPGQSFSVGPLVIVTLEDIRGDAVVLSVDAPPQLSVEDREGRESDRSGLLGESLELVTADETIELEAADAQGELPRDPAKAAILRLMLPAGRFVGRLRATVYERSKLPVVEELMIVRTGGGPQHVRIHLPTQGDHGQITVGGFTARFELPGALRGKAVDALAVPGWRRLRLGESLPLAKWLRGKAFAPGTFEAGNLSPGEEVAVVFSIAFEPVL